MLSLTKILRASFTLASAVLLGNSTASSAPIPVGPALTLSLSTQHLFQTEYDAWLIADLTNPLAPSPLQISTSVSAGYWNQQLTFGPGFPELEPGDTFFVQELITVGGDFAPTGWSQELTTAGWKWTEAVVFDNATAEPLPNLLVNTTDQLVSFSFAAVAPGTDLFIVKTLEYTGAGGPPAAPVDVKVQVVPEPGSAAMMLLGLASFALIRTRYRTALPNQHRPFLG